MMDEANASVEEWLSTVEKHMGPDKYLWVAANADFRFSNNLRGFTHLSLDYNMRNCKKIQSFARVEEPRMSMNIPDG